MSNVLQCRIFSSKSQVGDNTVSNWMMPVWFVVCEQDIQHLGLKLPKDPKTPQLILNHRIAREMNLEKDDEVNIEVLDISTRFVFPKVIIAHESLNFDACLFDIWDWNYSSRMLSKKGKIYGDFLTHVDGSAEAMLQRQPFWIGEERRKGLKEYRGSITVHFGGVTRMLYSSLSTGRDSKKGNTSIKNTKGPSGFGFSVMGNNDELIRGYGYYPICPGMSYPLLMGYKALVEGLSWALRMDPKKLTISGPKIIIQLLHQFSELEDPTLKMYHKFIKTKIQRMIRNTTFVLQSCGDSNNEKINDLANMAIDSKTHATFCNWDLICSYHPFKDILEHSLDPSAQK